MFMYYKKKCYVDNISLCNVIIIIVCYLISMMFLKWYLMYLQVLIICNLELYSKFICYVFEVTNMPSGLGQICVMCVYLYAVWCNWLVTTIKHLNPEILHPVMFDKFHPIHWETWAFHSRSIYTCLVLVYGCIF